MMKTKGESQQKIKQGKKKEKTQLGNKTRRQENKMGKVNIIQN